MFTVTFCVEYAVSYISVHVCLSQSLMTLPQQYRPRAWETESIFDWHIIVLT